MSEQVKFRHCGINQQSVNEDGMLYCHACHDLLAYDKVERWDEAVPKPDKPAVKEQTNKK